MTPRPHSPRSLHYANFDEMRRVTELLGRSMARAVQRMVEWLHATRGGTVRVMVVTTQSGETREVRQKLGGYRPQRRMGGPILLAGIRGSAREGEALQRARNTAEQGSDNKEASTDGR